MRIILKFRGSKMRNGWTVGFWILIFLTPWLHDPSIGCTVLPSSNFLHFGHIFVLRLYILVKLFMPSSPFFRTHNHIFLTIIIFHILIIFFVPWLHYIYTNYIFHTLIIFRILITFFYFDHTLRTQIALFVF